LVQVLHAHSWAKKLIYISFYSTFLKIVFKHTLKKFLHSSHPYGIALELQQQQKITKGIRTKKPLAVIIIFNVFIHNQSYVVRRPRSDLQITSFKKKKRQGNQKENDKATRKAICRATKTKRQVNQKKKTAGQAQKK
jgi:hypothetical protein